MDGQYGICDEPHCVLPATDTATFGIPLCADCLKRRQTEQQQEREKRAREMRGLGNTSHDDHETDYPDNC